MRLLVIALVGCGGGGDNRKISAPPAEHSAPLVDAGEPAPEPAQTFTSEPTTGGQISNDDVKKVMSAHIGKIQACYEDQLKANPKLAGRVIVKFTIEPKGNVSQADATGVSAEVDKCIAAIVKTLKFPAPKGGAAHVSYPFSFKPT